jgi:hypothetical protein
MERERLGLSLELRTPRLLAAHVKGGDRPPEHGPGTTLYVIDLASSSCVVLSLCATSRRTRQRGHVPILFLLSPATDKQPLRLGWWPVGGEAGTSGFVCRTAAPHRDHESDAGTPASVRPCAGGMQPAWRTSGRHHFHRRRPNRVAANYVSAGLTSACAQESAPGSRSSGYAHSSAVFIRSHLPPRYP